MVSRPGPPRRTDAPAIAPTGIPIAAGCPAETETETKARRPTVRVAIIDDDGCRGRRRIGLTLIGTEAEIARGHKADAVAVINLAPAVAAGTGIDGGTGGKCGKPGIVGPRPRANIDRSRNIGRGRGSNLRRDQNYSRNSDTDKTIIIKQSLK